MKIELIVTDIQNDTQQAIFNHLENYIDLFLDTMNDCVFLCQECIERKEGWSCDKE